MMTVAAKRVGKGQQRKVKFGDVVVTTAKPSAAEVKRNIEVSTQALERMKDKLVKAGIRLYPRKDVPLYSVDPEQPGTFIRDLNGKRERGTLEKGAFKVLA